MKVIGSSLKLRIINPACAGTPGHPPGPGGTSLAPLAPPLLFRNNSGTREGANMKFDTHNREYLAHILLKLGVTQRSGQVIVTSLVIL